MSWCSGGRVRVSGSRTRSGTGTGRCRDSDSVMIVVDDMSHPAVVFSLILLVLNLIRYSAARKYFTARKTRARATPTPKGFDVTTQCITHFLLLLVGWLDAQPTSRKPPFLFLLPIYIDTHTHRHKHTHTWKTHIQKSLHPTFSRAHENNERSQYAEKPHPDKKNN